MPNMSWVIDRGGKVAYRANWTSAANVEAFITRYVAARADRSRGAPALYETEQLEFRPVDRTRFNQGLLRNGPRAVTEFSHAMKLWGRQD